MMRGSVLGHVGNALLLLSIGFAYRLCSNPDVMTGDSFSVNGAYRIGTIPWSDACAWVSGADDVLAGNRMGAIPGRRPLYPLFLATIFSAVGLDYVHAILAQMAMAGTSAALAWLLLRDVHPRAGVWLFVGLLVVWRPDAPTLFMTENLGMLLVTVGFAALWRGLARDDLPAQACGMFLVALSEVVRPWCVAVLAVLPMLPLLAKATRVCRTRWMSVLLVSTALGAGFQPVATALFATPGHGSNFPMTLFGQVCGGRGWRYAQQDPAIKEAMRSGLPEAAYNRVIYRRCLEAFVARPGDFVRGAVRAYGSHCYLLYRALRGEPLHQRLVLVLVLFLLVRLDRPGRRADGWPLGRRATAGIAGLAAACLCVYPWLLLPLACIGLLDAARQPRIALHAFILLFAAGIFLSLPLTGADGGWRVRIAWEVWVFLAASTGAGSAVRVLTRTARREGIPSTPAREEPQEIGLTNAGWRRWPLVPVAAAVVLILIPYAARARRAAVRSVRTPGLPEVRDARLALGLSDEPMTLSDLREVWHRWPEPSFEAMQGKFIRLGATFRMRDTLFLDPDRGVDEMRWMGRLWPLATGGPARTVFMPEGRFIVFPGVDRERLRVFEGRPVVVVGRMDTRPRVAQEDTGYTVVANYVGTPGDDADWVWFRVERGELTRVHAGG